jgi:hypothetical protein
MAPTARAWADRITILPPNVPRDAPGPGPLRHDAFPLERTASAVRPGPTDANRLSAHGGGLFCRGSVVRAGLTRGGGHQDRAWRLLEHLQRHAAAQPGRKLAAA